MYIAWPLLLCRLIIKCGKPGCTGSCPLSVVECGYTVGKKPATCRTCGKTFPRPNVTLSDPSLVGSEVRRSGERWVNGTSHCGDKHPKATICAQNKVCEWWTEHGKLTQLLRRGALLSIFVENTTGGGRLGQHRGRRTERTMGKHKMVEPGGKQVDQRVLEECKDKGRGRVRSCVIGRGVVYSVQRCVTTGQVLSDADRYQGL